MRNAGMATALVAAVWLVARGERFMGRRYGDMESGWLVVQAMVAAWYLFYMAMWLWESKR
jgi:hypothetical protein